MATFEKIATVDVGSGGAASIDFASIPSTFTDLCIKLSARLTAAVDFGGLSIALNTSSSSFNSRILQGDGSSAVSAALTNFTGGVGGTLLTSNTFNNVEIYLYNYSNSANKPYSFESVVENNASAVRDTVGGGLWSNTAAINQITLTSSSGNFAQYSTATLYGIKKA
jgi:hypothetical protein